MWKEGMHGRGEWENQHGRISTQAQWRIEQLPPPPLPSAMDNSIEGIPFHHLSIVPRSATCDENSIFWAAFPLSPPCLPHPPLMPSNLSSSKINRHESSYLWYYSFLSISADSWYSGRHRLQLIAKLWAVCVGLGIHRVLECQIPMRVSIIYTWEIRNNRTRSLIFYSTRVYFFAQVVQSSRWCFQIRCHAHGGIEAACWWVQWELRYLMWEWIVGLKLHAARVSRTRAPILHCGIELLWERRGMRVDICW